MSSALPVVITPEDTTDVVVVLGRLTGIRWRGVVMDPGGRMRGSVDGTMPAVRGGGEVTFALAVTVPLN